MSKTYLSKEGLQVFKDGIDVNYASIDHTHDTNMLVTFSDQDGGITADVEINKIIEALGNGLPVIGVYNDTYFYVRSNYSGTIKFVSSDITYDNNSSTTGIITYSSSGISAETINAGSQSYIDEQIASHTHSWDDLKDKPFGDTDEFMMYAVHMFSSTDEETIVEANASVGNDLATQLPLKVEIAGDTNSYVFDHGMPIGDENLVEYPFYLYTKNWGSGYYSLMGKSASSDAILELYTTQTVSTQLDDVYISDNIARVENIPDIDASLLISDAAADARAVGDALLLKADINHNHNDIYYTEAEVDEKIAEKAERLTVTITYDSSTDAYSADKTYDEITEALDNNSIVEAVYSGYVYRYVKKQIKANIWMYTFVIYLLNETTDEYFGIVKNEIIIREDGIVGVGSYPDTLDVMVDRTISGLETTDKTLLGAINELNTNKANTSDVESIYETKTDATTKLEEAKTYADNAATTAASTVKNDLLNGAGEAYDTLKELGDLINENTTALDALEEVATGKADKVHTHVVADVTDLQDTLDAINDSIDEKSQVQFVESGTSEVLPVLTIHKVTQEEYDQAVEAGTLESKAIYLTPEEDIDLSAYATIEQLNQKADSSHTHDDRYYTEDEMNSKIDEINDSISSKADSSTLTSHTSDTTVHVTDAERTQWNLAEANQNAFAGIIVGDKVLNATSTTAEMQFIAGAGINISETNQVSDADITIENTGVLGVKGDAESTYRTGEVNITPANIGLGNVNNTSDADKPVSTAQEAAINAGVSEAKSYADTQVNTSLDTAKQYADEVASAKTMVQILTWEADD